MNQGSLFQETAHGWQAPPLAGVQDFDGSTYEPSHDYERLGDQLHKTFQLMRDGCWRTLAAIHAEVGGSEAGVSARLRDLRKPKFGGHVIERRRMPGMEKSGVFQYRVVVNESKGSS